MTDFRLISLAEDDGPAPAYVPRWRRAWCVLTGGHRTSSVQGMRYGALVTCGRCGWRRARW